MPDGYPKKSVQTTTLIEEQELAFALDGGLYAAQITNAFEIVEGQTYTVNWDGTEYECVCSAVQSFLTFGNLSIMGEGDDTGEPIICGNTPNGNAFITLDTAAVRLLHSRLISKLLEEIHSTSTALITIK